MKYRCVTIDDEPRAHIVLSNYISRLSYLELKCKAYDAIEAYEYLRSNMIDIIFLDINMPEVDGFKLLDMLPYKPTVIITTAYTDHAYKSFEYNAIDYLHKPIRFERFVQAVEKALKWKELNNSTAAPEYIEVKTGGRYRRIAIHDIVYIESMGNYAKLLCCNMSLIALTTTKQLEEELPRKSFVRIHKSFIINTAFIKTVQDKQVIMNNITIPVGKTYKKYLKEILRQ